MNIKTVSDDDCTKVVVTAKVKGRNRQATIPVSPGKGRNAAHGVAVGQFIDKVTVAGNGMANFRRNGIKAEAVNGRTIRFTVPD